MVVPHQFVREGGSSAVVSPWLRWDGYVSLLSSM